MDSLGWAVPCAFLGTAWITVITAATLSAMGRLDSPAWWALVFVPLCALAWILRARLVPRSTARPSPVGPAAGTGRTLLWLIGTTAVVAVASDLVLAVSTAPASWDALTYHLPRAALSLQGGSFYTGPVNYWAQAAHPVYSTALLILPAVVTRASEHAWGAWQLGSYVVAALGVRQLARDLGASIQAALFSACMFLVLPQAIVQAPTAGNDMLLAALTAIAALAIVHWTLDRDARWLGVGAAAIGLGLGTKASFVCHTGMLLVLGGALSAQRESERARCAAGIAAAVIVGVLLAAPSGYIGNVHRYGHLLGPPEAVAHAVSGPARDILLDGAVNTARLASDFVSLDGLPRVTSVLAVQHSLRALVSVAWQASTPAAAAGRGMRAPFLLDRPMLAQESHAYWGIAGLLLVWPAVFMALFGGRGLARALALAALAFLVAQGFSGPYDPWRGRYFLSSAVLAVPLTCRFTGTAGGMRGTLTAAAVGIVCVSGVYTALWRAGAPLITVRYDGVLHSAIWRQDRAAQMARNRPADADVIRGYEAHVPRRATVASLLAPDSFEFVLFGPSLARTVVPLGAEGLASPRIANADDLVFSDRRLAPRAGDVALGADWWLRPLGVSSAPRAGR